MKKSVSIFCVIVFSMVMLFTTVTSGYADSYVVTAKDGLNIRDLPGGEESQILGIFRHGKIIEVVELGKYWAKVVYGDSFAYVYRDYIKPVDETTKTSTSSSSSVNNSRAKLIGTVNRTVKVRKISNTKISIGTIQKDATAFIVSRGKYWTKIVYENKRMGYIPSDAVVITAPNLPEEGLIYRVKASEDNSYTRVNVRMESNKNSKRICSVNVGDYVKVIDEEGNWWKVIYSANGDTGYMAKAYLTYAEDQFLSD